MKIVPYSPYPRFETKDVGENVSTVLDKLLRITTKITELYASDILYTIEAFNEAREKNEAFYRILAFREDGVNAYKYAENIYSTSDFIQVWELVYTPSTQVVNNNGETLLRRARLTNS